MTKTIRALPVAYDDEIVNDEFVGYKLIYYSVTDEFVPSLICTSFSVSVPYYTVEAKRINSFMFRLCYITLDRFGEMLSIRHAPDAPFFMDSTLNTLGDCFCSESEFNPLSEDMFI